MELRQLEYFVAVAEEANFTSAAERVHISQSGVSAQIKQLERDLGATLIDRSGRVATLTSAGEALLGHARAALASAAAAQQAVDDVEGLVRGRLAVGMVTACAVTPLFVALAEFHGAHPAIDLDLSEGTSDELVAGVRSGALDLALIGAAGAIPPRLEALTIVSEGLAALVVSDHALADLSSATLAEVCAHPIVTLPAGTGVRAVFDVDASARGLQPRIALQCSAPDAIVDLAARGLGVAVLSATMAADFADRLRVVPIEDTTTPALLALVWRPTTNPARAALLHACRTAFGTEPRT